MPAGTVKSHRRALTLAPALILAAVFAPAVLCPGQAHAQFGSGGAAGLGSLADADIFVSVQKTQGTNLTARDQARFLNRAGCACKSKVWLRAIVLPSSAGKALAVDPSATVSSYVGADCNNSSLRPACKLLSSMPMSEFRTAGMTIATTVDTLYSYRIAGSSSGGTTGSGGATGTGGVSGTGGTDTGAGGSGGAGDGSTGGAGSGGTTGTGLPIPKTACDVRFTQTLWVFIGTAGAGDGSLGSKAQALLLDGEVPAEPALSAPSPAHQALILKWPALTSTSTSDLLGYQVLCARGNNLPVFAQGTFDPAFDSCATEEGIDDSMPWPRPLGALVCSDLLGPASSSYRLKTLENDVQYTVGLAAIDKQGNASFIPNPKIGVPILTKDFYYEYRHGTPQGASEGGFCAVATGHGPSGPGAIAAVGLGAVLAGLVVRARSRRRPGGQR